jgi:hypothetical protein
MIVIQSFIHTSEPSTTSWQILKSACVVAVLGSTFIVTKGCSISLDVGDIKRMVEDHEDGEEQSIPYIDLAVDFLF